jgi:tetratricopeptide (TPR) repeat protein
MSDKALERIKKRCGEAYKAGNYAESARLAAEGAALAERLGDGPARLRLRVWEGESHWQDKNIDAAVTALTEAAQDTPGADPADSFNALSTLLTIAIFERALAEAQALLARGREHLERHDRTASRHMLDLSEGNLAAYRGDWTRALGHYQDAYEHQRTDRGMPRFTEASYMIKLAETSFMLGDADGVARWCQAVEDVKKEVEGDHLRAEQARLLCHRAGLPEPLNAKTDAAGVARRMLRWLEEFQGFRADYARDAMHVLLLHGDWLSVETWLDYPGIGDDPFIAGDLHLARAREGLGLPPQDLVWPGEPAVRAPAAATERHRHMVPTELAAARTHYESKRDWAAQQDERLQTDHHARTLADRLSRVAELER